MLYLIAINVIINYELEDNTDEVDKIKKNQYSGWDVTYYDTKLLKFVTEKNISIYNINPRLIISMIKVQRSEIWIRFVLELRD